MGLNRGSGGFSALGSARDGSTHCQSDPRCVAKEIND